MIPVFAPWGVGREWFEALEDEAKVARDLAAFEALLPGSSVAIVGYGRHGAEVVSGPLQSLRRRYPTTAFVAVAPFDATIVRALVSVAYAGVVWDVDGPATLAAEVGRLRKPDPREILARLWESGSGLREPIPRTAFRRLSDPDGPPITTVKDLSRVIAVPESTLRRHWSVDFPNCSPSEVIRWMLLLRGLPLVDAGHRTVRAAMTLGVHEETLDRIAVALSGQRFHAHGDGGVRRRTLAILAECVRSVFGDGLA